MNGQSRGWGAPFIFTVQEQNSGIPWIRMKEKKKNPQVHIFILASSNWNLAFPFISDSGHRAINWTCDFVTKEIRYFPIIL
jgi:hypothetical protein